VLCGPGNFTAAGAEGKLAWPGCGGTPSGAPAPVAPVYDASVRERIQVALLVLLCVFVYAAHRFRVVWSCDSWAYMAQAQIFLGRDPGLHTFPDPLRHPALTPLGMDVARGGFVSAFPPGYSLLMALGGLVGGETWVNPLLGALSAVLVYMTVKRDTQHPVALVTALLWAACPLVAMNAVDIMSDMAATTATLGVYLLLRHRRVRVAGLLLGLCMMIRPMSILFLAPAALLLPRRIRSLLEFATMFSVGALVSAAVQFHVWGALLSPTYRNNLGAFLPEYFVAQFPEYLRESAFHLGPILALALVQGVRAPRESAPELAWLGVYFLVYPFAGPVDIDWTRPRFLLPAYPAAFILAARGASELLFAWHGRRRREGARALLAASLCWGVFSGARAVHLGALLVRPDRDVDSDTLAARLPQDALVGTFEFSGALRLYGGIETFMWRHPDALSFARAEYARGRPLYFLLEPDASLPPWDQPFARAFTVAFDLAPVLDLRMPGYVLHRAVGVRPPGHIRLSLTDPLVQWALGEGWLSPSQHWGERYRAMACDTARISLPLERAVAHHLEITAAAAVGGAPGALEISIEGTPLGSVQLGPELRAHRVDVPAAKSRWGASLELHVAGAPRCGSGERKPVARVESIEARAL
jgi:hypothetical protein